MKTSKGMLGLVLLMVGTVASARTLRVNVSAAGAPAAGARVVVMCSDEGAGEVVARGRTNAKGRAQIMLPEHLSGRCAVWAGAYPGRGVAWTELEHPYVALELPTEARIRLEPRDAASGQPPGTEGVAVTARLESEADHSTLPIPAGMIGVNPSARGSVWRITGVPAVPGWRLTLSIAPRGYASKEFRSIVLDTVRAIDLRKVAFHGKASLTGTVRGGLHGIRVAVHAAPVGQSQARSVVAGPDGGFAFTGLAAGTEYELWASSRFGESSPVRIVPPQGGVVIELPKPRHISGKVVNGDYNPVERFTVTVVVDEAPEDPQHPVFTGFNQRRVMENPQGRFSVPIATSLRATVRIEADGYAPGVVMVPERQSLDEATVRLDRGLDLRGRVVAMESDESVPGARISGNCDGTPIAPVWTGEDGEFEFSNLPAGPCRVSAAAKGFVMGFAEIDLATDRDPGELELRLERGVSISGRVVSATTGEGIAEARVVAFGMPPTAGAEAEPVPRTARTDASGRFLISDCALGEQVVQVAAAGYLPASARTIAQEGGSPLLIEVHRGVVLEGSVLGAAGDGVGLRIVLQRGSDLVDGLTGYGGAFRIKAVPSGEIKFSVLGPTERGNSCFGSMVVPAVDGSVHHDIDCRGDLHSVSGILLAPSGDPLQGIVLFLAEEGAEGAEYQALSQADGRFRFEGVRTGWYHLNARRKSTSLGLLWKGDIASDRALWLTVPLSE